MHKNAPGNATLAPNTSFVTEWPIRMSGVLKTDRRFTNVAPHRHTDVDVTCPYKRVDPVHKITSNEPQQNG